METSIKRTGTYSLVQGLYWMIFCSIVSFAGVYLISEGHSASAIGGIVAAGNILGALIQPVIARSADRRRSGSLNRIIIGVALPGVLAVAALFFADGLLASVIYILLTADIFIMMPLINALGMSYNESGQSCDFGLARAVGSLAFAVISLFLGFALESLGSWTLLATDLSLMVILILVLAKIPGVFPAGAEKTEESMPAESLQALRSSYPGFLMVLAGVFLITSFHNVSNTYLIQILEAIGGSTREMGITISLAAVLELPAMFFYSRFQKRFGSARILAFTGIFWILKALAYLLAGRVIFIYSAQLLHALSFALFATAFVYYSNDRMLERDKVKGQALMTASSSLGNALGSLSGGFILDLSGVKPLLAFGLVLAAAGALVMTRGLRTGMAGKMENAAGTL